jgi:hypothetical protein
MLIRIRDRRVMSPEGAGGSGGAAAPGAGAGGAAAPGADAPPAGGNAPAAGGGAAAAPLAWLGEGVPDDVRGYVENKGWQKPADLLESYRGLEKLVGSDKIALPKGDSDEAGWNAVFDKLGRPKTAAEYKLPMPDQGGDPALAKEFSGLAHKAGLSQRQAAELTTWWNEKSAGLTKAQQDTRDAKGAAELGALQTEQGANWDGYVADAKAGLQAYGRPEVVAKLETLLGDAEAVRFLNWVGKSIGDDSNLPGHQNRPGAMSAAGAKQRIEDLKKDEAWTKAYLAGDADKKAEMQRLLKTAYPEEEKPA